ncbi:MAG TPA: sigma-70 family RNA polymerase sigma factor [Gemmataceae bacterium]|jgi:RNA polymerase sigma-70 factor (ECF subfamily)
MPESSSEHTDNFPQGLAKARAGSSESLGRLLMDCRNYLLLAADHKLGGELRAKVNPSDVVQETFLEAQRDFARFRGDNEDELRAWLYRILLNNLANVGRHYRETEKRAIRREITLPDRGEDSEQVGEPIQDTPTPSERMAANEEAVALEQALGRLSEQYQLVLRFRYHEQRTFADIGTRLNCSAEAARKLWARAVDQLQKLLSAP